MHAEGASSLVQCFLQANNSDCCCLPGSKRTHRMLCASLGTQPGVVCRVPHP